MRSLYYRYGICISASLMLLLGIMLYLLYRPQTLLVFKIINAVGLGGIIDNLRLAFSVFQFNSFIIHSLPAGLWTASYLMMMYVFTKFHKKKVRLLLALPLPISAIILEFLQLLGWCTGTFDVSDLICYVIPLLIFIRSISNEKTR